MLEKLSKVIITKNEKVVLITGAAGGIGKELCHKFYRLNYLVAGLDINEEKLNSLPKEFNFDPQRFLGLTVDITIPNKVEEAIRKIKENFGNIEVVINNAGGPTSNTFKRTTKKQWLDDIELNLNSVFYVLSSILPEMVKLKRGIIINIGSVNGLSVFGHPAYSAAKAGLINLTKSLAIEYGKYSIRCNVICPGTVKTEAWKARMEKNPNLWKNLQTLYSINELSEPSDIAEIAGFLASRAARMINGSTIIVDGGLTAGFPNIAETFIQEEF